MRAAIMAVVLVLAFPALARAQGATPVVGGGSFNTAPLLKPGRYADTVAAGETVYWKVAIAKGQILRVRATVDTSEIETDFSANGYLPGLDNLDYQLDLWSPLREPFSDEYDWRDASTELEGDDEAGAKTGEAASPRALGFEQILGTDFSLDKFPAPGEWYISVSVADSASSPAELPAELPVELDVIVEGTAQPSSADFASKLPGPTPEPTATPTEPTSELLAGSNADAGDPALTLALVAALALLGGARPRRARFASARALVKVLVMRHGGRRGDLALGAGDGRRVRLRRGAAAVHRRDQRRRARRVRGRGERGRGDGLPRRRRRLVVQLADPGCARHALRVRRADALDRVHGAARAGLRRGAVRRPARPRGIEGRGALAHGQLDQVARPALQRHARRRGRHQRRAVRDLGHAGGARHR